MLTGRYGYWGDQRLHSTAPIGAYLEEVCAGQSKPDFISKFSIALKEARKTLYLLKLMLGKGVTTEERVGSLLK